MSIKRKLIKSFMRVGAMRLIGIPLTLATSVLLARFLGPEVFGQYSFAMALVMLLALPVNAGIQSLLTREVAASSQSENWPLYKGTLRAALGWVLAVSLLILALYVLLDVFLDVVPASGKWGLLSIGIILVPLLGLNAVRISVIRGLGLPALAALPGMLIKPGIALIAIAAMAFTIGISGESVMWVQVLSYVIILVIGTIIFHRVNPLQSKGVEPQYKLKSWASSLAPFTLLALVTTFNTQLGILALGLLSTDEQVAALRVAERGAQFVPLSLALVNLVIGPHIVKASKGENRELLQKLTRQSARGAFAIALPIALVLFFYGDWLIEMLFGGTYSDLSYMPLVILAFGHLFNVFSGSASFILAMTGYEKLSFNTQVLAVLINLALCAVLIPTMGAVGAAIAVSASTIVRKSILILLVYRKVGVRSSVI